VPTVSVIIPARDAAETVGATFAGLAAQDLGEPFEMILVDDGSSDATPAIAERGGATVLPAGGRGPAAARNAGAAAATGDVLAFLDADCVPAPGWLSGVLAAFASGADLVQGRVEPDPAVPIGPFDRTLTVRGQSGLFETANLAIRRELFDELGGFESWLGRETAKELGEDVWLGWRARRAGARIVFASDALVHHAVFGRGWRDYAGERARLRFFPALAKRVPELRDELFFGRFFLNRRSAAFDLMAVGVALAAAARSPLPLIVAVPYAATAARRPPRYRRLAPKVAIADVAADLVGFAALVRGSVAARSLLI
jgi:glycosyltransferase involved in cell wall biosynthesis